MNVSISTTVGQTIKVFQAYIKELTVNLYAKKTQNILLSNYVHLFENPKCENGVGADFGDQLTTGKC